jgi:hypothetical protein
LQSVNKLASALSLFIKVQIWISHKKYIKKERWYLNLSVTMKWWVCLYFANRPWYNLQIFWVTILMYFKWGPRFCTKLWLCKFNRPVCMLCQIFYFQIFPYCIKHRFNSHLWMLWLCRLQSENTSLRTKELISVLY